MQGTGEKESNEEERRRKPQILHGACLHPGTRMQPKVNGRSLLIAKMIQPQGAQLLKQLWSAPLFRRDDFSRF
jgi:hypothetical protein